MRRLFFLLFLFTSLTHFCNAQESEGKNSKWGPNDTIVVPAIIIDGVSYPYSELDPVFITNGPYDKMVKQLQAYNRLRNAVYVTYPYARLAGVTINDINARMMGVDDKGERKKIIKS